MDTLLFFTVRSSAFGKKDEQLEPVSRHENANLLKMGLTSKRAPVP